MMPRRIVLVLTPALILVFGLTAPAAAQSTFTVNSGSDAVDAAVGSGGCATSGAVCTLRAAIQEANFNPATIDTINITVPFIDLFITGTAEDAALTGDLDITASVTINGGGAVIINRTQDRTFHIITGSLSINNLEISSARTIADGAGFLVNSSQILSLDNVHVHHNTGDDGVGLFASASSTINIVNSSFTHNNGDSGALYNNSAATFTVVNTTISNNTGRFVGGVRNVSNTGDFSRFEQVTITENLVVGSGAGSAGGLVSSGDFGPVLKNSILAANTRLQSGSAFDCASSLAGDGIISQGGNVFGSPFNCAVTFAGDRVTSDVLLDPLDFSLFSGNASHTPSALSPALFLGQECQADDQNGNPRPANSCTAGAVEAPLLLLTTNGGFESGLSGWTVAGTSVKAKDLDPLTGLKHLELKGGSASVRIVSQKITLDPLTTPVPEFVVVDLYYQAVSGTSIMNISLEFKREFGEKVKLKLPVVNDTLERLPADYSRATYRLLVDERVTDEPILTAPRATPPPSSVTFKLIDSSLSGKLYVDDIRVYFYGGEVQPGGGARGTDPGTRGLPLLPPPLIPDGFRGKN